jgi:uncharacterized protein YjbI with pentapeptide repeats
MATAYDLDFPLTTSSAPARATTRSGPDALLFALREGRHEGTVDLKGAFLADADMSGLDLTGADLSGANLARANLTGAMLFGAQLSDAVLVGAQLSDADFTGANLERAILQSAKGQRVGFGGAQMAGINLGECSLEDCSFVDADLSGSDLRAASLTNARLSGAKLHDVDATSASFHGADLSDCDVERAVFDRADLRHASLIGILGYESASWIGSDVRDIAPLGTHLWKRFVGDQNYLQEFRSRGPVAEALYRAWWLTSDCGRSVGRWGLCTLALIMSFGFAYNFVDIDFGSHATWLSPYYFSVVTVTTLGYGDVQPASVAGQVVAMAQVLLGYVMLGGLLSILSNKMARRSE